MIRPRAGVATAALVLLLSLAGPASAGTGQETSGPAWSRMLLPCAGDQDVVLTVSSVEWGPPDRWSFTARCVHMFDPKAERDTKPWPNNLTVKLSPGTAGGRLGIGYQSIYTPHQSKPGSGLALLGEARAVLLRTWGDPLVARPDRTFAGGEARISLVGVVNVGVGYRRPLSGSTEGRDSFWGYHVGIGV